MAIQKETPIELNGKTRHLRFDLNAVSDFETLRNMSIAEVFKPAFNEDGTIKVDENGDPEAVPVRVKDIRDLLWAALVQEDKDLTPQEVGSWLTLGDTEYILTPLMEALAESNATHFPPSPEAAKEKKPQQSPKK